MRREVCREYIRKERTKSLLVGAASLAGGAAFAWMEWTLGVLRDVRMAVLAVPLFLCVFAGGVYLLARGLLVLAWAERSDLCTFIRSECSPAERDLSKKEMLELVERDMECAAAFADGSILIGKEWLFVTNSAWKPVLRLEHLRSIKTRRTKDGSVILKFLDRNGGGPVTREIPSAEAGAIQAFLKRNADAPVS